MRRDSCSMYWFYRYKCQEERRKIWKKKISFKRNKNAPEVGCGQEVLAMVCSQKEDVQLEVHRQFGLGPEKASLNWYKEIQSNYVIQTHREKHILSCKSMKTNTINQDCHTSAWRPACSRTPVASYITCQKLSYGKSS